MILYTNTKIMKLIGYHNIETPLVLSSSVNMLWK